MKFVSRLPPKRAAGGGKYDRLIGDEAVGILRRNPSRWARIGTAQPRGSITGYRSWGKRHGMQVRARANPKLPDTLDIYARYQPARKRPAA